jgi:Ran GTPase-activating protein (RanGAP) involved in mRNA processing and transport
MKFLSEALEHYNIITRIKLSDNNIGNEGVIQLSKKLSDSVRYISLRNNIIGNLGIKFLCESLKNNIDLEALDLRCNKIGMEGARFFGELFKKNNTLYYVNFTGNYAIGDKGIKFLANGLIQKKTIMHLDLINTVDSISGLEYIYNVIKSK